MGSRLVRVELSRSFTWHDLESCADLKADFGRRGTARLEIVPVRSAAVRGWIRRTDVPAQPAAGRDDAGPHNLPAPWPVFAGSRPKPSPERTPWTRSGVDLGTISGPAPISRLISAPPSAPRDSKSCQPDVETTKGYVENGRGFRSLSLSKGKPDRASTARPVGRKDAPKRGRVTAGCGCRLPAAGLNHGSHRSRRIPATEFVVRLVAVTISKNAPTSSPYSRGELPRDSRSCQEPTGGRAVLSVRPAGKRPGTNESGSGNVRAQAPTTVRWRAGRSSAAATSSRSIRSIAATT
jgi:hypothetical protein